MLSKKDMKIFIMTNLTKKNTVKQPPVIKENKYDYSNDPFFIKKREISMQLLQKSSIPKTFRLKKS